MQNLKKLHHLLLAVIITLLPPLALHAQSDADISESGRYYIQNYDYKEYAGHQENWEIVQDPRGIIYVANNWGILEYDGRSWRMINPGKNTAVISIAVDSSGVIYAGLENDFGYLAVDEMGKYVYTSLAGNLKEEERTISSVWRTHAANDGIYFYTAQKIYFWKNDSIKIAPNMISALSALVNGTVHYGHWENGVMRIVNGEPQKIPGGDRFRNVENQAIIPYPAKEAFFVATRQDGLFLYDGNDFQPFQSEANDFIKEYLPYSGASFGEDMIVIGTIQGGAAIINGRGELQAVLNTETGLRNQTIVSAFFDRTGSLWLSLLNGISRVEVSTPFTRFGAENGIEGGVVTLNRFQERIYAGGNRGIFYLDSDVSSENQLSKINQFKQAEGNTGFVWGSYITDDKLFIGADRGTFIIDNKRANRIEALWPRVYGFYRSEKMPNRIYCALQTGVSIMEKQRGEWQHVFFHGKIGKEMITVTGETPTDDRSEVIWLGTKAQGAVRIVVNEPSADSADFHFEVNEFGEENGLPAGDVQVAKIDGKIVFMGSSGLRRFDAATASFPLDSSFGDFLADSSKTIGGLVRGPQGDIWAFTRTEGGSKISVASGGSGASYQWTDRTFRRINDLGEIRSVWPEENGAAWIGGSEGIVRFSGAENESNIASFNVNIRQIRAKGDSVIFGGKANGKPAPVLKYAENAMRFEYAAAYFNDAAANQYQYLLEGFDAAWSNWSAETQKDYTNLPEEEYVFRVRARNIYGDLSEEAAYQFRILPPWYRTLPAYLLYGILAALAITAITRFQIKRVRRQAAEDLQREKERAKLQEATLRAEAAELKAKAAEAEKEREKELMRSRIASDLHDEIGSNLSSISVISQMLTRKEKIGEKERQRLTNIHSIAQHTAGSMRDIVWFINPVNDSLEKLLVKMRETANVMLDHLEFTFQTPSGDLQLETDINFRRNLFLIYKESLQNTVKHSRASHVDIEIKENREQFRMEIRDNGVGFNTDDSSDGNGLRNFKSRASQIGGTVAVRSEADTGTQVVFTRRIAPTNDQ